jgi:uncharacterized protein (TIGR02145 family)
MLANLQEVQYLSITWHLRELQLTTLVHKFSIRAEAAFGYEFVNWIGSQVADSTMATTTINLNSNMSILANFRQTHFKLTINANPTVGGNFTPASGLSHDSSTINISATANSGYRFVNWTVASSIGMATFDNADNAVTTVTLRSDATIRANFRRTYTLTISSDPPAGGTFTPESGLSYDSSTVVDISAVANGGHGFINWEITSGTATFGNANNASTTVRMSSNTTIRANFRQLIQGTFTDSRDNHTYRWVTIGTQTWMAENLNFNATGSTCYNNRPDNCATYGRLYNWSTVMDFASSCNSSNCAAQVQPNHRGICPEGWHVPSDDEWTTLVNYAGGESTAAAATRLKATNGWIWDSWNNTSGNGTDEFGFSALPGGHGTSSFWDAGKQGFWWSATESNWNYAWYRRIDVDANVSRHVARLIILKDYGYSARCVRD